MPKQLLDEARVSRKAFVVTCLAEAEEVDQKHWRSRTPDDCLTALELAMTIIRPATNGIGGRRRCARCWRR